MLDFAVESRRDAKFIQRFAEPVTVATIVAKQLAVSGIKVNSADPGYTATDFNNIQVTGRLSRRQLASYSWQPNKATVQRAAFITIKI